jgi:hypothetical protein
VLEELGAVIFNHGGEGGVLELAVLASALNAVAHPMETILLCQAEIFWH